MKIKDRIKEKMLKNKLSLFQLHKMICMRYGDDAPTYETVRRILNGERNPEKPIDMIFDVLSL